MSVDRSTTQKIILILVAVFSIILAFSSFQHVRKMELEFNERKARLIKENMDFKDKVDTLKEQFAQKEEAYSLLEREQKQVQKNLLRMKTREGELTKVYAQESEHAVYKRMALKHRIRMLENMRPDVLLKNAIRNQENKNVKSVLQNALDKIEQLKQGKGITLTPIVVTKKKAPRHIIEAESDEETPSDEALPDEAASAKRGQIISVDYKNALIVINLGSKSGIHEGDRFTITNKSGDIIAHAEILSVRHALAAAFIDDIEYGYRIRDIKEKYPVAAVE